VNSAQARLRQKETATGAVFTCPTANYTVLGGTVRSVFHDSFGANGSEHVSGTTSRSA
jgi:hypothetical protein